MIEISAGIELGPGVVIGDTPAFPTYFVTDVTEEFLTTETGDRFIEE